MEHSVYGCDQSPRHTPTILTASCDIFNPKEYMLGQTNVARAYYVVCLLRFYPDQWLIFHLAFKHYFLALHDAVEIKMINIYIIVDWRLVMSVT